MQIAFSFLICFPSLSKTRQHLTHLHIMHSSQPNVLQIWSAQERAVKWANKWKNEWVKEHCGDMSKVTQRPVWSKSRMKALGCKSGDKMMLLSFVAKSWDETIATTGTKKPNLDLLSGSCFVGDTWQIPYLGFHFHTELKFDQVFNQSSQRKCTMTANAMPVPVSSLSGPSVFNSATQYLLDITESS